MKKLLTTGILIGISSLSYGQGSVNFSAGALPATRIWTNSSSGGPYGLISGAGNYYFALFVAPTTTGTNYSLSSSLDPTAHGFQLVNTPVGAYGTNTASLGRMNGNPTTDGTIVSGYAPGTSANFVVVGWSANIAGPDWAAFRALVTPESYGWAGHSAVAEAVQLGGGLIPQGTIFGGSPGQATGFGLYHIPEPSIFALMALGAAALMISRHRSKI